MEKVNAKKIDLTPTTAFAVIRAICFYFLGNLVEKVNAKKINMAFITNLNFVRCQGQTLSYVPMTKKTSVVGYLMNQEHIAK